MDAMVTARMQASKKEAGNRVLEKLGTNASSAINDMYDYLISQKTLPWLEGAPLGEGVSPDRLQEALSWVDSLQIELSPQFAKMSLKDAKKKRLGQQASKKQ